MLVVLPFAIETLPILNRRNTASLLFRDKNSANVVHSKSEGGNLMSSDERETISPRANPLRRYAIYALILVVVFLLGLVPMWLSARNRAKERDDARRELRLSEMENDLSAAAINARRGEYEPARQATSRFFTSLGTQCDVSADPSDLTKPQCDALRPLLDQRDELITLLARSDPASADRLTAIYVAHEKAMTAPR